MKKRVNVKRWLCVSMRMSMIQLLLVLVFTGGSWGRNINGQDLMDRRVSLKVSRSELRNVLNLISKEANVRFTYNSKTIQADRKVDVNVKNERLEEVLNQILKPLHIEQDVVDGQIILRNAAPVGLMNNEPVQNSASVTEAADRTITGKVSDAKGGVLPGVSIVVKGSQRGTTTNENGAFSISIPTDDVTLIFSFVGYTSQEIVVGAQSVINLTLAPDTKSLNEVIVVGYGTQKRRDVLSAVSSVSEKDFKAQPVTRVDQVLQGRVPGVQVTNSGGAPGGDVRIRIRGSNSLSGDNEPLYVVDGFVGADFTTINPDDISSVEVLKDASATSIYGSRGANGVIIISTKSGKSGAMQVSFGVNAYSSKLIKKYNTLNAADFAETVNQRGLALAPAGSTYIPRFSESEIQGFRQNGGTDWQDEIFRTAPGKEYKIGISGGNEKTNYLISGNYLTQDGIIDNSDFKRYSIRTNIASQLSSKFSFRMNFTGTRKENHNTSGTSQRSGALAQALAWAPTTPVYDANGNYILYDPTSSIFSNPVALAKENEYRFENTNINILTGLRYEILSGLSLDVQVGLNYGNLQSKAFQGIPASRSWATAGRSSSENITLQNTNTLNYKKTFNDLHRVDITAVFETQKFIGTGFNANVTNLTYPAQSYNNLALSASSTVGSGYGGWSILSTLGRFNYSFKDRYLVSATVRRDGSSKFQGDNKYSVFPSIAVGWKASEESFIKDLNVFSNLKIRGSWGLTGNQGIGSYGTLSSYVTNLDDAGAVFNGAGAIVPGIMLGNPGNVDLKWETTEQINAGADLEFLDGRVTLTADYFVKNTRDLLMLRSLPGYIGGYSIQSNIGQIQNKGWEFALGVTPVRTSDFSWNTSVNLALLKNKVVSLGGDRDTIPLGENVLIPGHSMNSFWGYKFLGTFKANEADQAAVFGLKPGDAHYQDVDGNGIINEKDYQIMGNGTPKMSVGWNNTFAYKNLSLNVFFQGMLGFDKLNYTYANGMLGSTDAKEIIFQDIKKRYIPGVNESSEIPAFSSAASNMYVQTSRFIERGDFLRLKNVSLSYTIPKSILKNIASVRLFLSATNLLTITKYKGIDPESNSNNVSGLTWDNFGTDVQQGIDYGSYPNSKTYTAGLNLTF
ncbi:TonB-dependent receptor [Dyadobacter sp. NIV53]|uniref:TonB-dependent receptor n=1 Tax=Dyadobacter sp. NIV53 TaxID=2861765 RepID=UPI001C8837F8|nr:TonB-dependent receptor [Dyadobacter sp. NIV53]